MSIARLSLASTLAAPLACASSDLAEIMAFFQFLHEDRKGYLCINAGIADDQAVTGILMLLPSEDHPQIESTRKWFYYDPERPDLLVQAAHYVLELEAQYGNVYTARTLFRSKSAKQDYAYASPILFLDDAPRDTPLPYSLYVDTGTGNGQAYYRLTGPLVKADALRVKRALSCDPTGSADNKLIRIPGTRNTKTKHGGNYRVSVELETPTCYSREQLHTVFPPIQEVVPLARERTVQLWDAAKEQRLMAVYRQVDRMLTPTGIPRVIAATKDPHNQGRRIFEDRAFIESFRHPSGSWDASRVRWWRAKALILRGVTDEQATALIYACEHPATRDQKGSSAVWNDIKRCVDHWRAAYPQIAVSAYSQQLQMDMLQIFDNTAPLPAPQPRARKGRPSITLSPADVITRYQAEAAQNRLLLNRQSRAGLLGVSTATLDRLELILRDRGDLVIHTTPDRRGSWVEILGLPGTYGVIKNTGLGVITNADLLSLAETPVQGNTTPESKVLADVCIKGDTHPFSRQQGDGQELGGMCLLQGTECVPPQSLEPPSQADDSPTAVQEAPAYPIEHLRFTGTLLERVAAALELVTETPKRKQGPLVQAILAAQNIPLSDKKLALLLADARYLLKLRDLPDAALKHEYHKARACLVREQKRLGLANFAAMQAQSDEREHEGYVWVLFYHSYVAHQACCERFPVPPELDERVTRPSVQKEEIAALAKQQRGKVNPASALQRSIWRREGMDEREIDARETLEELEIGRIRPTQKPEPTLQCSADSPYDAKGLPDRLRSLHLKHICSVPPVQESPPFMPITEVRHGTPNRLHTPSI